MNRKSSASGGLMARILDGVEIAAAIKKEVAEEVSRLRRAACGRGLPPCWWAMFPLQRFMCAARCRPAPSSDIYSDLITPSADVTTEAMLALVNELNRRDDIDGILIQLPLPEQVDAKSLLDAIDAGEGCRWLSSGQRGPACRPDVRRWRHARRQASSRFSSAAIFRSPASTQSSWAAATLWASPRRCCCCTRMRP